MQELNVNRADFFTVPAGGPLQNRGALPSVREEEVREALAASVFDFKALLRDADARALEQGGEVLPADVQEIVSGLSTFSKMVDELIGDESGLAQQAREDLGSKLQADLLPYLLMSDSAERWYAKPRGYAGDFLTIERYYENRPSGSSRLGPALDRAFLSLPASKAVQNRLGLLVDQIRKSIASSEGEVTKVTSLACGPARELFDCYDQIDPRTLQSTLVDMDFQALAFVADKRDRRGLKKQMHLVNENLIYLASGRRRIDLEPQDLVYSIGLIDYLVDDHVVALMNYCYDILRPGGRLILGNFHPRNPEKAMMDHLVNWRLIHRTEDDLHCLYARSKFARPCTRVLWEEQGINMFGECVKQ